MVAIIAIFWWKQSRDQLLKKLFPKYFFKIKLAQCRSKYYYVSIIAVEKKAFLITSNNATLYHFKLSFYQEMRNWYLGN